VGVGFLLFLDGLSALSGVKGQKELV